ncbi:MAG: hypothetical protein MUE85_17570 [Microscillaceae bacterium]|jgi:hypothetical protein|nr:hypothetical protein [Microscillaceae bacterium]
MRFGSCLFFLSLIVSLNACKSADKSKDLVGLWQMMFDSTLVAQAMKPAEHKLMATLLPQEKQAAWREIAQKIKQNTLEFRRDKTFELILKEEAIREKGTWELKNDRIILTKPKSATQTTETQDELRLKTLANKRLTLEYKNAQGNLKEVTWQLTK